MRSNNVSEPLGRNFVASGEVTCRAKRIIAHGACSPCSPTEDRFQNSCRPYATDDKAFRIAHPAASKQRVGGSNPSGRATFHQN